MNLKAVPLIITPKEEFYRLQFYHPDKNGGMVSRHRGSSALWLKLKQRGRKQTGEDIQLPNEKSFPPRSGEASFRVTIWCRLWWETNMRIIVLHLVSTWKGILTGSLPYHVLSPPTPPPLLLPIAFPPYSPALIKISPVNAIHCERLENFSCQIIVSRELLLLLKWCLFVCSQPVCCSLTSPSSPWP